VHRDLKSANILVQVDGTVKIGDLGLCVEVKDGNDIDQLPVVGSKYWMAPEMLHYKYAPSHSTPSLVLSMTEFLTRRTYNTGRTDSRLTFGRSVRR